MEEKEQMNENGREIKDGIHENCMENERWNLWKWYGGM